MTPAIRHTVRDEARAHTFYREVLGMEEMWRGGADPARTSWVNMRVPDGTDERHRKRTRVRGLELVVAFAGAFIFARILKRLVD